MGVSVRRHVSRGEPPRRSLALQAPLGASASRTLSAVVFPHLSQSMEVSPWLDSGLSSVDLVAVNRARRSVLLKVVGAAKQAVAVDQVVALLAVTCTAASGIRPLPVAPRPPALVVAAAVAVVLDALRPSAMTASEASAVCRAGLVIACDLEEDWPEYEDKSCPDEGDEDDPDGFGW